jgi:hypothetical protein
MWVWFLTAVANLYAAASALNQISKISPDGLTVSTFATGIPSPEYIAVAPTPEPGTLALAAIGALAFLSRAPRRRTI